MERYGVTADYSSSLRQRPTFHINFSSQLRHPTAEGHRLRRLTEDTELSIFDAERYFNEGDDNREEEDDGPVQTKESVLGKVDSSPDQSDSYSLSSHHGGRRSHHQNRSLYATPTASSEASWNSRSGLLSNPPGSVAVTVRAFPLNEQRKGSSFSVCQRLLGRTCPCSGKKAVKVQENCSVTMSPSLSNVDSLATVSINKNDSRAEEACIDQVAVALKELEMGSGLEMAKLKVVAGNWTKEEDLFRDSSQFHRMVHSGKPFKGGGGTFSFPVLSQPITASAKKTNSTTRLDEPSRDSLEVFRPPEEAAVQKNSAELHGRAGTQLQLFSRDVGPRRSFTFPPSPSGRVAAVEDDLASDSSSDLFEIESLSTQVTTYGAYRRRDSLDEQRNLAGGASGVLRQRRSMEEAAAAPSVAASECYPPSEVSVEWSVTTAEGGFGPGSVANFSSAASDCDGAGFTQLDHPVFSTAVAGAGKRRGGGLLSCRSEKAVSVGPDPVRCGAERRSYQFPPDDYHGGIPVLTRGRNGSSAAAHLARVAGAPPTMLAHSQSTRQSLLGR